MDRWRPNIYGNFRGFWNFWPIRAAQIVDNPAMGALSHSSLSRSVPYYGRFGIAAIFLLISLSTWCHAQGPADYGDSSVLDGHTAADNFADLPSAPSPAAISTSPIDLTSKQSTQPMEELRLNPVVLGVQSPAPNPAEPKGVNWGGLAKGSFVFLGAQHMFRLATEDATRGGFDGHFLQGYLKAVGNLHGWGDGDEFLVNYVGHPMEGSVAGYIWIHNDRQYRMAEIGRNSLYWQSRIRAAGFAYLYSVQFEIGPVSEASIGKIQAIYPQQGFVDHIVTPIIGTGWLIAEDTLDKYVIARFEERVQNPYAQTLMRGALNPSRSFANMMELRVPWSRDTRPSPWSGQLPEYFAAERDGLIASPQQPEMPLDGEFGVPLIQVNVNTRTDLYWHNGEMTPCVGGGGVGTFQLLQQLQFVADVSGCKVLGLTDGWSGDTLTYTAGPQWTPTPGSRWNPYVHVLVGGMASTYERNRVDTRDADQKLISSTAEAVDTNNFTVKIGGGIDYRLHPLVALHLATFEYKRVWTPQDALMPARNGMSLSAGIVLR
jgi:hypothetical protein